MKKKNLWNQLYFDDFFFLIFSLDTNHDDEFVSDSYQASSADIDEVNASMKTLGVKGTFFP